jgi:hypothetical protein
MLFRVMCSIIHVQLAWYKAGCIWQLPGHCTAIPWQAFGSEMRRDLAVAVAKYSDHILALSAGVLHMKPFGYVQ